MRKTNRIKCPICGKGELHKIAYDLYYCIVCKEEFALNDSRGLLWYKRKSKNSYEHEFVVVKKLKLRQIHAYKIAMGGEN